MVDDKIKVRELFAVVVVVEDQVYGESFVRFAEIHVTVGDTIHYLHVGEQFAGPSAEDFVVAPRIDSEFIPTALVVHVEHMAVVLDFRCYGSAAPAGDADSVTLA